MAVWNISGKTITYNGKVHIWKEAKPGPYVGQIQFLILGSDKGEIETITALLEDLQPPADSKFNKNMLKSRKAFMEYLDTSMNNQNQDDFESEAIQPLHRLGTKSDSTTEVNEENQDVFESEAIQPTHGQGTKSDFATEVLAEQVQGMKEEEEQKLIGMHVYIHINNLIPATKRRQLRNINSDHVWTLQKEFSNEFQGFNSLTNTLPLTLYIQADNCFRENKNKYVLGFCEMLVRKNIFTEVHLSFLYVGHTHEDIDAAFSKIADTLRTNDAHTLVRLLDLIPNSQQLDGLYNIKEWMEPHFNYISRHSKPLHFKFRQTTEGEVEGSYKGQHDGEWIHFEQPIIGTTPSGIPNILMPTNIYKLQFEEIQKTVDRTLHLMTDGESRNWWKRFIDNYRQMTTNQQNMTDYANKNAVWILDLLPTQRHEPLEEDHDVAIAVLQMLDRHTEVPKVQVRGR